MDTNKIDRKEYFKKYHKEYYLKNRERLINKFKERYNLIRSNPITLLESRKKGTEATRRYRNRHPERVKAMRDKMYNSRRTRAMEMIGGAKCIRCGCDKLEFLEFNHKNGGGCREYRKERKNSMVDRLLSGKRNVDDLNVLCRVCNALDFLERKDIKSAMKYQIKWK